jgi:hypothetical protein
MSDRDKTWTSKFWKALRGQILTTAYHPQADGQSEWCGFLNGTGPLNVKFQVFNILKLQDLKIITSNPLSVQWFIRRYQISEIHHYKSFNYSKNIFFHQRVPKGAI